MSESQKHKASANDHVRKIAGDIIDMIEKGHQLPPEKRWRKTGSGIPMNYATKHVYTGCNLTFLALMGWCKGWDDQRYVTRKQLDALEDGEGNPAKLNPGATPCSVMRPFRVVRRLAVDEKEDISSIPEERLDTDEEGNLFKLIDRICFSNIMVYNVEETTAVVSPMIALEARSWTDCEFFENLVKASGIEVKHSGDGAFYNRKTDSITMPHKDAFNEAGDYYGVLMHEFFHATGAPCRFNREKGQKFGDEKYAIEELRAELFSAVCENVFGIGTPSEVAASYLDSWRRVVNDGNPKIILKAASDVEQVVSAVIDIACGKQPAKAPWFPVIDFSSMPTPLKDAVEREAEAENAKHARAREQARLVEASDALALRVLPGVFEHNSRLSARQVGETLLGMPPLNSTDRAGDEAIAHLHMQNVHGDDVYLTEFAPDTGAGFGWCADAGNVFSGSCRLISPEMMAQMHSVNLDFEAISLGKLIADLEERVCAHYEVPMPESYNWPEAGIESVDCDDAYAPGY